MEIKVTFRHLDPENKLKEYAEKEIEKLERYLHRPLEAQAIFSREKRRGQAELHLYGDGGHFFAREEKEDLLLAFDQALGKVEAQVKRHHDKWKRSKGKREPEADAGLGEITGEFEVIRSGEHLAKKPITVEEAVEFLGNSGNGFVVFRDAGNEKICVVYRRPDGNFGLIEPE